MGNARPILITISIATIIIATVIACAIQLDDSEKGKGGYFLEWGPGTTMDYQTSGGYTMDSAGYDVPYSLDGSTQHDEIVSSTATDFTYERVVTMKVTYTDPTTGEIRTRTQSGERTYTQDRMVRYDDCSSSTMETEWGTKNVLIIRSIITDDNGNKIDSTDYRDESTFVRLKAEVACDALRTGTAVLKDWHMTYMLTDYELK